LKHDDEFQAIAAGSNHQEQVPRKQGLKRESSQELLSAFSIKSKFHENKD